VTPRLRTVLSTEADPARLLRVLLGTDPDLEICREGSPADLQFIDVRHDDPRGWARVETLVRPRPPEIVLLVGKDPHLLRACDQHGVGYLLEPLRRACVRTVLRNARARILNEPPEARSARLASFLIDLRNRRAYPERLAIRSRGMRAVVKVEEIDWIEAAANYVRVHASGRAHVLRHTLSALETSLDPRRFARIHRCRIVNVERIRELQPVPNGRYAAILLDGTRLELSREQSRKLPVLLGAD